MPNLAKRTRDKKGTAQRILKAAVTCFAENGFAGTSARTIAAAAKVNVATLAYHFQGKEGLYRAAIDSIYEQFFAVTPDIDFSPESSVEERVGSAMRFVYRFSRTHRLAVRLLMRHVMEHGHLPEKVRADWVTQLLERAKVAWSLLGLPEDPDWRLKLLTLNHLIARFSITEPEDLAPFMDAEDPHAAIEEHMVKVALRLLS